MFAVLENLIVLQEIGHHFACTVGLRLRYFQSLAKVTLYSSSLCNKKRWRYLSLKIPDVNIRTRAQPMQGSQVYQCPGDSQRYEKREFDQDTQVVPLYLNQSRLCLSSPET